MPHVSKANIRYHSPFYTPSILFLPLVWLLFIILFYSQTFLTKVLALLPLLLIAGSGLRDLDTLCSYPTQLEQTGHILVTLILLSYCILFVLLSLWTNQTTFPNIISTFCLSGILDAILARGYFFNTLTESYSCFTEVWHISPFLYYYYYIFLFFSI